MSAKLWVKRVTCVLVFVLFATVVVNIGNDKFSVFCRDNPKGASYGLINFGAKALYSVVSLIGVLESESEQGYIFSVCGRSAGKSKVSIITLVGVASGESEYGIGVLVGVAYGKAETSIVSCVGVAYGYAKNQIASVLGLSFGKGEKSTATIIGFSSEKSGLGISFTTNPNKEVWGLIAIRYLRWNYVTISLFWDTLHFGLGF